MCTRTVCYSWLILTSLNCRTGKWSGFFGALHCDRSEHAVPGKDLRDDDDRFSAGCSTTLDRGSHRSYADPHTRAARARLCQLDPRRISSRASCGAVLATWIIRSKISTSRRRKIVIPCLQAEVQGFTAVDNSDLAPTRLTVPSDSPYDKETVPATHFKQ